MIPLQGQILMLLVGVTILVIVAFKSERVKTWIDENGCKFGFHEWGKWEEYGAWDYKPWKQHCTCKRCNKRRVRSVKGY